MKQGLVISLPPYTLPHAMPLHRLFPEYPPPPPEGDKPSTYARRFLHKTICKKCAFETHHAASSESVPQKRH